MDVREGEPLLALRDHGLFAVVVVLTAAVLVVVVSPLLRRTRPNVRSQGLDLPRRFFCPRVTLQPAFQIFEAHHSSSASVSYVSTRWWYETESSIRSDRQEAIGDVCHG